MQGLCPSLARLFMQRVSEIMTQTSEEERENTTIYQRSESCDTKKERKLSDGAGNGRETGRQMGVR